jgi:diacylglycerol kinase family enzyme
VGRAALAAGLPLGIVPMGRVNNVYRSLGGKVDVKAAIATIVNGRYRNIDVAKAADQPFIGAIGFGFIPEIAKVLSTRSLPRYSFGWAQLAAKAAAEVRPGKMLLKVDSYRFEISPSLLSINLLPYSCGLRLTPASLFDDGHAEIVFDPGLTAKEISGFARQVSKGSFQYGAGIKLYRGKQISLSHVKGQTLYLDGELLTLPNQTLDVTFESEQLKVYC